MTLIHNRWLASAGCLTFLICVPVPGCSDEADTQSGTGGTAGFAGMAGNGGMAGDSGMGGDGGAGGMAPLQVPGLWEGQTKGVEVCFYIREDGLTLTENPGCSIGGQGGRSFDLGVELVGTDENGQACSFELEYDAPITIDQDSNSFRASTIQPPGSGVTLSFSGELVGQMASGIARRDEGNASCRAGWVASASSQCNDKAIQTCLDLQACCRAILVSPVFFETCNAVVLQCDETHCREVLDGYPQCAPEPEPEP